MATGYLLETNTVIDFSSGKLPEKSHKHISAIIDTFPQISIINKIELLSFSNVSDQIISFAEEAFVIALDENIAAKTIDLRKKI